MIEELNSLRVERKVIRVLNKIGKLINFKLWITLTVHLPHCRKSVWCVCSVWDWVSSKRVCNSPWHPRRRSQTCAPLWSSHGYYSADNLSKEISIKYYLNNRSSSKKHNHKYIIKVRHCTLVENYFVHTQGRLVSNVLEENVEGL